jgi:hypothetical protein
VILITASGYTFSIFKLKGFAIVGGEDANKFTLNGSELTFKAPDSSRRNMNLSLPAPPVIANFAPPLLSTVSLIAI